MGVEMDVEFNADDDLDLSGGTAIFFGRGELTPRQMIYLELVQDVDGQLILRDRVTGNHVAGLVSAHVTLEDGAPPQVQMNFENVQIIIEEE
jgi:hypothetical protein